MTELVLKKEAEKPEEYTKVTPGVGTDVFIRKKAPGSQVGEGYIVDIYENGVKVDTMTKDSKRETLELIREFKEKYNTDRAFQNELQVHITYKTKEERGELAMTSLDNQLMKKASTIQNILFRLLRPEMPVIRREAQDESDVPAPVSAPTAPGGEVDKEQIKSFMLDEILKKYTQFVKDKVSESAPIDDIYNALRKWYGRLTDNILLFNKQVAASSMSNRTAEEGKQFTRADLEPVIEESTKILTSGDPQLISENTGIEVDQVIADTMKEVGTKSVGKPGEAEKGGELGGDPETSQTREEAAASEKMELSERTVKGTIEDDIFDFEKMVHSFGSTRSLPEIAKDLKLDTPEKIKAMHEALSRSADLNESQTAIKVWVADEMRREETASEKIREFWKYAGTIRGVHHIDDIFMDWLPLSGIENLDKASRVWDGICRDIESAFSDRIEIPDVVDKKADYAYDGIARIVMTFFDSQVGTEKTLLDAYFDYRDQGGGLLGAVPTVTITSGDIVYNILQKYIGNYTFDNIGEAILKADEILDMMKADPTVLKEIAGEAGVTGDVKVMTQLKLPDKLYKTPGQLEQVTRSYPDVAQLSGKQLNDEYTISIEPTDWTQQSY